MFAAGALVPLKAEVALDRVLFAYAVIICLVSSAFCGLFIGTEHSDGTLRNKLVASHTKASVYISNLIVCTIAGSMFCLAFIIPVLAIGVPRLGFFEMDISSVWALFRISLALSAAFSGVYAMISCCAKTKLLLPFPAFCLVSCCGVVLFKRKDLI